MTAQEENHIDHFVWEAYYVSHAKKGHQGTLFAVSKEVAKSRILDECDLNGDEEEWEDQGSHKIHFHHSPYYLITVVRRAVYAK